MFKRFMVVILLVSIDATAMQWCKNGYFSDLSTFWALIVASTTQTSKERNQVSSNANNNGICWLELLPAEIQDHIASYLIFRDRETDEQFIKRALAIAKNRSEYNDDVPCISCEFLDTKITIKRSMWHPFIVSIANKKTGSNKDLYDHFNFFEFAPRVRSSLLACSPDSSKIVFGPIWFLGDQEKIQVLNINKSAQSKYSFKEDSQINNSDIGISNDGKMLALLYSKSSTVFSRELMLDIFHISDLTKDASQLSDKEKLKCQAIGINASIVAFNKQGTKVIVRNDSEYEIFPLVDEDEHKQKSLKTLQDYFRQRGVCKELKNSASQEE